MVPVKKLLEKQKIFNTPCQLSLNIGKCTFWHLHQRKTLNPAHLHNLISLRCPHEEIWHPWLSKMCPVKILIGLCKCASWSESLLGMDSFPTVHFLMSWSSWFFNWLSTLWSDGERSVIPIIFPKTKAIKHKNILKVLKTVYGLQMRQLIMDKEVKCEI